MLATLNIFWSYKPALMWRGIERTFLRIWILGWSGLMGSCKSAWPLTYQLGGRTFLSIRSPTAKRMSLSSTRRLKAGISMKAKTHHLLLKPTQPPRDRLEDRWCWIEVPAMRPLRPKRVDWRLLISDIVSGLPTSSQVWRLLRLLAKSPTCSGERSRLIFCEYVFLRKESSFL